MTRIERKIGEAFARQWPHTPEMAAILDADTRYDETAGGIVGGISISVTDQSGKSVTVHHEPADVLKSADDVDDWLARTLSTLLSKHPSWPR